MIYYYFLKMYVYKKFLQIFLVCFAGFWQKKWQTIPFQETEISVPKSHYLCVYIWLLPFFCCLFLANFQQEIFPQIYKNFYKMQFLGAKQNFFKKIGCYIYIYEINLLFYVQKRQTCLLVRLVYYLSTALIFYIPFCMMLS